VACAIGPSVSQCYNIEWNQHMTLFVRYIPFLKSQVWNKIILELNGRPSTVNTFSTDFSFQNLFFKDLFEAVMTKSLKISYLSHPMSKISQNNGSLLQASHIVLEPYLGVFWLVAWDKFNTFLHIMVGTNYACSLKFSWSKKNRCHS